MTPSEEQISKKNNSSLELGLPSRWREAARDVQGCGTLRLNPTSSRLKAAVNVAILLVATSTLQILLGLPAKTRR